MLDKDIRFVSINPNLVGRSNKKKCENIFPLATVNKIIVNQLSTFMFLFLLKFYCYLQNSLLNPTI